MAGATSTGHLTAKYKVDKKSSAIPAANFAIIFAVAGAVKNRTERFAVSTWEILDCSPFSLKGSQSTLCPLSEENNKGVIILVAFSVIMT